MTELYPTGNGVKAGLDALKGLDVTVDRDGQYGDDALDSRDEGEPKISPPIIPRYIGRTALN